MTRSFPQGAKRNSGIRFLVLSGTAALIQLCLLRLLCFALLCLLSLALLCLACLCLRCLLCFALLCDTARLTMKVYATQPCCAKSRDVFLSLARCVISDLPRSFHGTRNRLRDKTKSFTKKLRASSKPRAASKESAIPLFAGASVRGLRSPCPASVGPFLQVLDELSHRTSPGNSLV